MPRVSRLLTPVAVAALAVGITLAGLTGAAAQDDGNGGGSSTTSTTSARSGGGSPQGEVLAKLVIERPEVEVRKAGSDDFEPATDGQKLREGDTVRTDATGRAEVQYSDDAYTRLDVNTTFTIAKLTEEQGARQVEGSLDTGRTWNRTQAVTESGSFEQSGGGATAAVAGTAFAVECTSLTECTYTAVVDSIELTGDGVTRHLTPLTECDSNDGALCDAVRHLTPEEIAANAWIQENLLRDLLERGFGPGPFVVGGTLVIQDGQVVSFTFSEEPPPAGATTTTTTTTTQPPGPPAPAIADPPIACEYVYQPATPCDQLPLGIEELQPTNQIVVYEGAAVVFQVRVVDNGTPGPVFVVFDQVPENAGRFCLSEESAEGSCNEDADLVPGEPYPADEYFIFNATYCGEGQEEEISCEEGVIASGTLRFHLVNAAGAVSPQASVHVEVHCDYACSWYYGESTASVAAAPQPSTSTSSSTTSTTNRGVPSPETSPPSTVSSDSGADQEPASEEPGTPRR